MVLLNTCGIQCGAPLESYPTARKQCGLCPAWQALLQQASMSDLVVERAKVDSEAGKTTLEIKKKNTSVKAASRVLFVSRGSKLSLIKALREPEHELKIAFR